MSSRSMCLCASMSTVIQIFSHPIDTIYFFKDMYLRHLIKVHSFELMIWWSILSSLALNISPTSLFIHNIHATVLQGSSLQLGKLTKGLEHGFDSCCGLCSPTSLHSSFPPELSKVHHENCTQRAIFFCLQAHSDFLLKKKKKDTYIYKLILCLLFHYYWIVGKYCRAVSLINVTSSNWLLLLSRKHVFYNKLVRIGYIPGSNFSRVFF